MREDVWFNEFCGKLELWRDVGSAIYDPERVSELMDCDDDAHEHYRQNSYDKVIVSISTLKRVREFLTKDLEKSIDEAKGILNAIYEEVN